LIAGTPSWNDVSNNRAYAAGDIALTANGVSLYFALKNDPATSAIAEDTEHQLLPKGLREHLADGGTDIERHGIQAQPLAERRQSLPANSCWRRNNYEPWLNANSGYWRKPLTAYADAAVWSGDPKVKIFKGYDGEPVLQRLQGPDLDRDRRGECGLRSGADVRFGCDRRRDARSGSR